MSDGGEASLEVDNAESYGSGSVCDEQQQLNRALASAGLPSPIDLWSKDEEEVQKVQQVIFSLLSHYNKSLDAKEDLNEQRRRLQADAKRLEARDKRLQEEIAQKEREMESMRQQCEQAKSQAAAEAKKARQERDAANKKASDMQQKNTQYNHEMKKKDKAYSALQERLNALVTGKAPSSKPTIEMSGTLRKQRSMWQRENQNTGPIGASEEMQRSVSEAREHKLNGVLQENKELKQALHQARRQIRGLTLSDASDNLNTTASSVERKSDDEEGEGGDDNGDDDDEDEPPRSPPGAEVMDLPYDLARQELERGMQEDLIQLRERLQKVAQREPPRTHRHRVPCGELPANG